MSTCEKVSVKSSEVSAGIGTAAAIASALAAFAGLEEEEAPEASAFEQACDLSSRR